MADVMRTARADEDLIEIWLDIARHDPFAADRLLDRIDQRLSQLARHPQSGVARPDVGP